MSAQRASAPVRFARLAAAVLLIALAAVIVVRLAGRREGPAPARVLPPPEGRIVDLKERVRQQEYKDGRPVVDIRGESFFRGPDGRNHLTGSVEIVNLGPGGETVSRLSAGEVVYDPGSLRFTVTGHVRVEAAGVLLEGETFEYDKKEGLLGTAGGGRFSSKTISGHAPELSYRESTEEIRLGGGFQFEMPESGEGGPDRRPMTVSGQSLVLDRRWRRGRIEGRASIRGARFQGTSKAASFVAAPDESSLESAVLEGAAKVVLIGKEPPGEGNGEIRADRIAVSFGREPSALAIQTTGRSSLSLRSAQDRTETVLAPAVLLNVFRGDGHCTWSASGGIRAEIKKAGAVRRTLEGQEAALDSATILHVSGGSGRPAVADSAEARIEAPEIAVATQTGDVLASGGVACILKRGDGRRTAGFFSPNEDVSVSSEKLELRAGTSTSLFTGSVIARQGTDILRAGEIEIAGETGGMTGGGGVTISLTEAAEEGRSGARTIELHGEDMAYRSDLRTLAFSSKASVKLPDARLEAATITAVIGRDGNAVESLAASTGVSVSSGRYVGRSESASYQAATGRITLTGRPFLTDDKGGSARGAKLTFDLTDDKILIENEGSGRATTVVRS
jgi:lipopolysaccharide export system protein LptA